MRRLGVGLCVLCWQVMLAACLPLAGGDEGSRPTPTYDAAVEYPEYEPALTSLRVGPTSSWSPNFEKDTFSYRTTTSSGTAKVTVGATALDPEATITVNSSLVVDGFSEAFSLQAGENVFTVEVTISLAPAFPFQTKGWLSARCEKVVVRQVLMVMRSVMPRFAAGQPMSSIRYIDEAWTQEAYIKASNTGAGDGFGRSVAVLGDRLAVGARSEDSSATGVASSFSAQLSNAIGVNSHTSEQQDNSKGGAGAAYLFE